MRRFAMVLTAVGLCVLGAPRAWAADVVHLGNLKFAHYGAISYLKEIGGRCGLQIEERVFAKGLDIMPAIVAGEIDVAASALDAAIAGRAGGVPIYAVAGFAEGGARIVGRSDLGLKTIADLKGRRVGVARGGAQELLLLAELGRAGLTWSDREGKDVQLVYLAFADLNQALMAKEIDVMSQSEPQSSQAINRGFGTELMKPYDTPMGKPIRVLVMAEDFYKKRPDVAVKFMHCFVEATRTFISDPALAQRYVLETMFKNQITAADYQDAMGNAAFTYDLPVNHVQITTDMMVKYGVGRMTNPPRATDWVRLDLLDKAKADLGVR